MAWATPKTNWVPADGVADADLNRGEENTRILSQYGGAFGVTAGTSTAYTVTASPPITALADGVVVTVKIHTNNAGACTLAVNGLTAKGIYNPNDTGVVAGALKADLIVTLRYSTTYLSGTGGWIVQGGSDLPATANPLSDGSATPGTALKFAREDHVHPTDTTRAPTVSPTFTGTVTMPASNHGWNVMFQPQLKDYSETVVSDSTSTGAESLNIANGNVFNNTLTGNVTYSFTNQAPSGQCTSITIIIKQGSTVYTVTWPASVKWADGNVPDLSVPSTDYVLTFFTVDGGTTWYGSSAGAFN